MTTLTLVAACFLAGLFQDALSTGLTRCVTEKKAKLAGVLSIIITLFSYLLFAAIYQAMTQGSYCYLLSYSIGGGLGTWVVVSYKGNKVKNDVNL